MQEEVCKLQALKSKARPQDDYLFIYNLEEYLKKATVYSMTTYILMTKQPIMKSVDRWKRRYDAGVVSIMTWIRQVPGNKKAVKQAEKRARILWQDGRKKKQRRETTQEKKIQLTLKSFFIVYHLD